ncbi:hypothetical protein SMICM17S_03934 [Streptomyces microflavus]
MSATELTWFKSSYRTNDGPDCVEVATAPAAVHVRDSKQLPTGGPHLGFTQPPGRTSSRTPRRAQPCPYPPPCGSRTSTTSSSTCRTSSGPSRSTAGCGLARVRVEEWRAGKVSFPSVRINPNTIINFSARAVELNVDHICLAVEPLDWQEVIDSGVFDVKEGPGRRSGARGSATSLYVYDPDGNTVELRWYPQDA